MSGDPNPRPRTAPIRKQELTPAEVQALRRFANGETIGRHHRRRLEALGGLLMWKGRLVVSPAGLVFLENTAPRSPWSPPGESNPRDLGKLSTPAMLTLAAGLLGIGR